MSVERVAGIEPAWPAWKAGTLPLSYTRALRMYTPVRGGRASNRKPMSLLGDGLLLVLLADGQNSIHRHNRLDVAPHDPTSLF
jgi:hypothetical protein